MNQEFLNRLEEVNEVINYGWSKRIELFRKMEEAAKAANPDFGILRFQRVAHDECPWASDNWNFRAIAEVTSSRMGSTMYITLEEQSSGFFVLTLRLGKWYSGEDKRVVRMTVSRKTVMHWERRANFRSKEAGVQAMNEYMIERILNQFKEDNFGWIYLSYLLEAL